MKPASRGNSLYAALMGVAVVLMLILLGTKLFARVHTNLFSLTLAQVWTDDTLIPTAKACPDTTDDALMRQLQKHLQKSGAADAHLALHRGEIACLSGNVAQAVDIWSQGLGQAISDPVRQLYTATGQFSQGVLLTEVDAEGIANYAASRGKKIVNSDLNLAIAWLEMAVAYDTSDKIVTQLASYYKKNAQPEKAAALWKHLQQSYDAESATHWFAQAKGAALAQDWAAAMRAYVQAAEREKDIKKSATYYRAAGKMGIRAQHYDAAQEAYQKAINLQPDKVTGYLDMGSLFRTRKRYDQAAQWYEKARSIDPHNYQPDYYLGLLARDQKHYDEAVAYFDRALELKPENATLLYYKAVTLDNLQRRSEATDILQQAIEVNEKAPQSWQDLLAKWQRNPDYAQDPDRWWEKGHLAEKEKDWEQAAAIYHQGAQQAQPPDDYRLLAREGLMRRYLHQWPEAAAIFEDLVARYPDKLDAYLNRGEVARAQGLHDEAASWFQRAQEHFPDDYRPSYHLGLTARSAGQPEKALTYFDQSLRLKPGDSYTHYYKAHALKEMGQREEAIHELARAIELHAKHPESWKEKLQAWQAED
jgi:tetratricopeptide (TPR) repeat protein